uniref:Uncharacterized protein n=1 Tax=Caenorhabditis japonica TaxID=281687 RepID=A0A8R1IVB5_CAEJA
MLNFGINPDICDWFKSFLANRISKVKIEWCVKWKLALAENKTLVLHLGKSNPKHSYFTGTTKVQSTTCARDLGILVDDALTFENHIDKIVNNALHKSRMVLRSFRSSNPNFYFKLFNVFIRPTLEYGCELFHPSSSRLTARLDYPLRFFSRKVFIRCNMSFRPQTLSDTSSPYERRLRITSQHSLLFRRLFLILKTYFKIVTHRCHFPNLSKFIQPANSTRFPYRLKLCCAKNDSFLHKYFSLWDKIVPHFPKLVSEEVFASRVGQLPLESFVS